MGSEGVEWGAMLAAHRQAQQPHHPAVVQTQVLHFHHYSPCICAYLPLCLHASMIIHVFLSVCLSVGLSVSLYPPFLEAMCMYACLYVFRYVCICVGMHVIALAVSLFLYVHVSR